MIVQMVMTLGGKGTMYIAVLRIVAIALATLVTIVGLAARLFLVVVFAKVAIFPTRGLLAI